MENERKPFSFGDIGQLARPLAIIVALLCVVALVWFFYSPEKEFFYYTINSAVLNLYDVTGLN